MTQQAQAVDVAMSTKAKPIRILRITAPELRTSLFDSTLSALAYTLAVADHIIVDLGGC